MTSSIIWGLVLGAITGFGAAITGLERSRLFYPLILVAIALFYVAFATTTGDMAAITDEAGIALLFVMVAVAGYRWGPLFVAFGAVAHGLFDLVHTESTGQHGAPDWWPAFCGAYDIMIAIAIARWAAVLRHATRLHDMLIGGRSG